MLAKPEVSVRTMEELLRFIYCGYFRLQSVAEAEEVLVLAQELVVKSAVRTLVEHLRSQLTAENCMTQLVGNFVPFLWWLSFLHGTLNMR